jgi:hypothetical protein
MTYSYVTRLDMCARVDSVAFHFSCFIKKKKKPKIFFSVFLFPIT